MIFNDLELIPYQRPQLFVRESIRQAANFLDSLYFVTIDHDRPPRICAKFDCVAIWRYFGGAI